MAIYGVGQSESRYDLLLQQKREQEARAAERAGKTQEAGISSLKASTDFNGKDEYVKGTGVEGESAGIYGVESDEDGNARVVFNKPTTEAAQADEKKPPEQPEASETNDNSQEKVKSIQKQITKLQEQKVKLQNQIAQANGDAEKIRELRAQMNALDASINLKNSELMQLQTQSA